MLSKRRSIVTTKKPFGLNKFFTILVIKNDEYGIREKKNIKFKFLLVIRILKTLRRKCDFKLFFNIF